MAIMFVIFVQLTNFSEVIEGTRCLFHVTKPKGCFFGLPSILVFSSFHAFLLQLEEPDEGCIRPSEDVYCFLAGDPRVNEQTVLFNILIHFSLWKRNTLTNPSLSNE